MFLIWRVSLPYGEDLGGMPRENATRRRCKQNSWKAFECGVEELVELEYQTADMQVKGVLQCMWRYAMLQG